MAAQLDALRAMNKALKPPYATLSASHSKLGRIEPAKLI